MVTMVTDRASRQRQAVGIVRPSVRPSVCLSVCLSARITRKPRSRTLTIFLCVLLVIVARASSEGIAIRYLLPVLRMTNSSYYGTYVCTN